MKDNSSFLHDLIQKEFRSAMLLSDYKIPIKLEGVVVLSGPDFIKNDDNIIDYSYPDNIENKARIERGVEIVKQILANKIRENLSEINYQDNLRQVPPLILSGDVEQLPIMKKIAEDLNWPKEKIVLVDCCMGGSCNTKTQCITINNYCLEKNFKHIIFVTSDYHVPRVFRTGYKNLSSDITFTVLPVAHEKVPYDVVTFVRAEIKRIILYIDKGDIANTPPT